MGKEIKGERRDVKNKMREGDEEVGERKKMYSYS